MSRFRQSEILNISSQGGFPTCPFSYSRSRSQTDKWRSTIRLAMEKYELKHKKRGLCFICYLFFCQGYFLVSALTNNIFHEEIITRIFINVLPFFRPFEIFFRIRWRTPFINSNEPLNSRNEPVCKV